LGSILGSMRLALRHTAGRRANHTDDPTIPSDQGLDPEAAARLRLAGCNKRVLPGFPWVAPTS
jgi:hypothetical protein